MKSSIDKKMYQLQITWSNGDKEFIGTSREFNSRELKDGIDSLIHMTEFLKTENAFLLISHHARKFEFIEINT